MRTSPSAFPLLVLLTACGGSSTGSLTVPLAIASTSPAADEAGVAPTGHVTLIFSEPLGPMPLITNLIQLYDAHGPIPYAIDSSVDQGRVELTPIATLGLDNVVTVRVPKTIRSATGRAMASDATWTFRTRDGKWSQEATLANAGSASMPVLAHAPSGQAAAAVGPAQYMIVPNATAWNASSALPFGALLDPAIRFLAFDDAGGAFAGVTGTAQGSLSVLLYHQPRYSSWQDPALLSSGPACCTSARFSSTPSGQVVAHWQQCQTGPTMCRDGMRLLEPLPQGGLQGKDVALEDGGQFPWRESACDGKGSVFVVQRIEGMGVIAQRIAPAASEKETFALDTRVPTQWKALAIGADAQTRAIALVGRQSDGAYSLSSYRYLPGAGFSAETVLWQGTEELRNAQMKMSASGHAILAVEIGGPNGSSRLLVATFDPTAESWRTLVTAEDALLPAISSGVQAAYFALGIAPNGEAWVVLDRINAGGSNVDEIAAVRYHARGGAGSKVVLARGELGTHYRSLAIAGDAGGRATALWATFQVPALPVTTVSAARFE